MPKHIDPKRRERIERLKQSGFFGAEESRPRKRMALSPDARAIAEKRAATVFSVNVVEVMTSAIEARLKVSLTEHGPGFFENEPALRALDSESRQRVLNIFDSQLRAQYKHSPEFRLAYLELSRELIGGEIRHTEQDKARLEGELDPRTPQIKVREGIEVERLRISSLQVLHNAIKEKLEQVKQEIENE